MNLLVINAILFGHWMGDFILQKNKKKTRKKIKNKNLKHIIPHTFIYTSILTLFVFLLQIFGVLITKCDVSILYFFLLTYITHFFTDFIITKINEKHLKNNDRNKYFVTIGLDQFIHFSILFSTISLLYII